MGSNRSHAWHSIHSSLKVIRKGTRWRVGNGKTIHIWEDKWLLTPTTYKTINPPCCFNDFPIVSALIDQDTKRWKANLVKKSFLPFEANTILNISLSYSLPNDNLIWLGNTKGVFTARSAYYVALSLVETSNGGELSVGDSWPLLWKRVWHLNLPDKIRIFAWRARMNALSTMQNLKVRGSIQMVVVLCMAKALKILCTPSLTVTTQSCLEFLGWKTCFLGWWGFGRY